MATPYAGAHPSHGWAYTTHVGAHVWAKHRLNRCLATHEVNPAMLRPYGDVATPYAGAHPSHVGRQNVISRRRNVISRRRNVISRRRNVPTGRRNVPTGRRNGTRGRTCRGEASPESVYGTHAVNQAMLRPYGGRGHPICGGASVGTGRGNPIGAGASVGTGRGNPIGAGASVGTGRGHPICGGAAPLPSHRSRATIPAIERGTDPERKGA